MVKLIGPYGGFGRQNKQDMLCVVPYFFAKCDIDPDKWNASYSSMICIIIILMSIPPNAFEIQPTGTTTNIHSYHHKKHH